MTAPVAPMEARAVRPWETRLAEAMQEVQRDPSKRTLLEIGGLKAKALAAEIADWRALAAAQAAPVASNKEFDSEQLLHLAMAYRDANNFSKRLATFKEICNYVKSLIAPVAQPAQQVEALGQIKQWRTFGEVPWFDGEPPHSSPAYETRTLYAAPTSNF